MPSKQFRDDKFTPDAAKLTGFLRDLGPGKPASRSGAKATPAAEKILKDRALRRANR